MAPAGQQIPNQNHAFPGEGERTWITEILFFDKVPDVPSGVLHSTHSKVMCRTSHRIGGIDSTGILPTSSVNTARCHTPSLTYLQGLEVLRLFERVGYGAHGGGVERSCARPAQVTASHAILFKLLRTCAASKREHGRQVVLAWICSGLPEVVDGGRSCPAVTAQGIPLLRDRPGYKALYYPNDG